MAVHLHKACFFKVYII
uniref:Uncharacterized protein n=1 Tax=Rhizophora mucronata TaxID=61149 RepID=A0A2P2Q2P5_RHIMU